MPRPRTMQGLPLRDIVALHLGEMMRAEEKVHEEKVRARRRYERTMPNGDVYDWDVQVNDNPQVKAAIADHQFLRDKVKAYSAAAGVLGKDYVPWKKIALS